MLWQKHTPAHQRYNPILQVCAHPTWILQMFSSDDVEAEGGNKREHLWCVLLTFDFLII